MPLPSVFKQSSSTTTVCLDVVGKDPSSSPLSVAKRLYGGQSHASSPLWTNEQLRSFSVENIENARKCGKWGPTQPSQLFLGAFWASLMCLESDALSSMVSPSLMGCHGTLPLAIISPLPDIVRHMSNLIARAQREVILVTCSWSPSTGTRLIHNALVELSKRAGERGQRVTVKVMFDKAGPASVLHARHHLKPEQYATEAVGLPRPEEIPNLEFEVMSFHAIVLGTLHAKFMVVDGEVAVVQSNNMEDNDNMEMMVQLEGPVVDSIYDTALITWGDPLKPTPPCISRQEDFTAVNGVGEGKQEGNEAANLQHGLARDQQQIARDGSSNAGIPEHTPDDPHYDPDLASEINRMQSVYSSRSNETRLQAINRVLNKTAFKESGPSGPDIVAGDEFTPYIPIDTTSFCPIAIVSRPPFGPPVNSNDFVPQNAAWLSLIANAEKSIFIQTPDLNASPLYASLKQALERGIEVTYYVCLGYNDAGELMPGQGGLNEMFAKKLTASLSGDARSYLHIFYYVAKDQSRPIHHSFRARSCHIKLLIVDGHVGVQGSGNQDTQSWYHSQEINILVDSEEVCRKWREGIERNQNTAKFGRAGEDGIWRDEQGHVAEGSTAMTGGPIGWAKGVIGMVKKAKDSGRFHA